MVASFKYRNEQKLRLQGPILIKHCKIIEEQTWNKVKDIKIKTIFKCCRNNVATTKFT